MSDPQSSIYQHQHDEVPAKTISVDKPARRPFKKRAPAACLSCRGRKVRCDVVQHGQPCSNCSLDDQECIVKRRPTRYHVSKHSPVEQSRHPRNAELQSASQFPPALDDLISHDPLLEGTKQFENSRDPSIKPADTPRQDRAPGDGISLPFSEEETGLNNSAELWTDPAFEEEPPTRRKFDNRHRASADHYQPLMFNDNLAESAAVTRTHVIFSYYPFLEMDTMSHISPEDVNFLEQQECFRIPIRPMLDEFVKEYFLHVHPNVPMLNEGDFWDMYPNQRSNLSDPRRISLFLFQAMLFASCSFVSLATIRKLGFTSIRNARNAYYKRAQALFNFDRGRDSVSTAQGTLLLAYHVTMKHARSNSYWLGVAIQFAKEANAHRYDACNISAERRNILKRLWWSCVIRDRILPLGTRRSVYITPIDFDFKSAPLIEEDFEVEINRSRVYNSTTKRSLARLTTALCELAALLTDIIMLVYPSMKPSISNQSDDAEFKRSFSCIDAFKADLNGWFERTTVGFPTPAGIGNGHDSVTLYTDLMYIYYYSAKVALCHHAILVSATQSSKTISHWDERCQSKRELEEAAGCITESLKELIQLKLIKYLPISVVAYSALPLVWHILDVKLSTTVSQTAMTRRRLDIYTDSMHAFQTQYEGTDKVFEIIGQLVDHIKLESTSQRSLPEAENITRTSKDYLGGLRHESPPRTLCRVNDWGDILLRQPSCYLRLTLTIDLSLSNGRFPDNNEFPASVQWRDRITRFPLYRITSSEIDNTYIDPKITDIRSVTSATTENDRNSKNTSTDIELGRNDERSLTSSRSSVTDTSNPIAQFELPIDFPVFDMLIQDSDFGISDFSSAWAMEMSTGNM